jgi:protein TonB
MLTTLIASRASRTNSFRAQSLSVALHAALITGAVLATQRAAAVLQPVVAEPVHYVPVTDVAPRPAAAAIAAPRLKGFQLVPTPIVIPDALPPIDLSRPVTDPNDFSGSGVLGGHHDGVVVSPTSGPLTEDQVDVQARLVPGTGRPSFPESLRAAGLAGEVSVQFVVDSTGRADMKTLEVLVSSHERFTEAVRRALKDARFVPAEFRGKKVPQLVRMPFVFSLQK